MTASRHGMVTALQTATGRMMRVGTLPMPGVPGCARVTMAVECASFDRTTVWISLTGDEAHRLAAALTEHAARLDH